MPRLKFKNCIGILAFVAILSFGLCHIHAMADVTEGGILGLVLLLEHHFGITPAITSLVLNIFCYLLAFRLLGKEFLGYSAVAVIGFSVTYRLFELLPPLFPNIYTMPLLAAVLGALFVGVGVGGALRLGGAPSGDDALAMAVSHVTPLNIQTVYLIADLAVLLPSLTYIPVERIMYSLLTVILSGQLVGLIQKIGVKKHKKGSTRQAP